MNLLSWIQQCMKFRCRHGVNTYQKSSLVRKIHARFGDDLSGLTFCVWGLAFKPGTDDVREAPSLTTIKALTDAEATVQAYDPEALDTFHEALLREGGQDVQVKFCTSARSALEGADALVIMTEWKEFWQPDFSMLAQSLRERVVFDGRNIYDPAIVASYGLDYFGIGRFGIGETSAAS